jgi:hypothetical protein
MGFGPRRTRGPLDTKARAFCPGFFYARGVPAKTLESNATVVI